MNHLSLAIGAASFLFGAPAFSYELTRNQRLDDFNQLVSTIRSKYGPLEYKKETQHIDLNDLYKKYESEIEAGKTNGDFYYSILRFVAEFHDGHFSASVPSDYAKTLGIRTDLVQGKVLVESVDRGLHSEKDFPFEKGDEILKVDDQPVEEVVATIQKQRGSGFIQSEKRRATMGLFVRSAAVVPVPTSKTVSILAKHRKTGESEKVTLSWIEKGTPLDEAISTQQARVLDFSATSASSRETFSNYKTLSIKDQLVEELGAERLESTYWCSGNTRIAIPEGATKIMETPFVAYYWPTPKGNLGYLRIPHYAPQNATTGADEYEMRFNQYEYAVSELEKNTVGLVIDQDHNCGGSVDYLEKIVGLFMQHDYSPLTFRFTASKTDYLEWKSWLNSTAPFTIEHSQIETVMNEIKDAWMKGERMTALSSFNALTPLRPNARVTYTKPIVMLIDENSGSGGDAFPSLMKGFGRAKLIGTRTMGLGGHVTEMPDLVNSGIKYRITRSLFYRPDGVPVENNGAVPDYPYEITADDFINGYKNYRDYYTKILLSQLP